jgi:hypothetical protein
MKSPNQWNTAAAELRRTGVPQMSAHWPGFLRFPAPSARRSHVGSRLVVFFLVLVCVGRAQGADAPDTPDAAPKRSRAQTGGREALLFRNGDLLYGTLESISPDQDIRWHHADSTQSIQFAPENVAEIHFPPHHASATNLPGLCRFRLGNNDELEGSLVQVDQEKALLRTWYAGEVTIPRKALQALIPVPPEGAIVFQGPTGVEGWTVGKVQAAAIAAGDTGQWKYKNGAFYATNAASIARDVHLPDTASVEFDLAWKGLFQLAIALYTDYLQPISLANKDSEPEFGGFYSLQVNSFSANLLPVKKNDPLRYLGQVSVPAFNQKNAAHVELRASKSKRIVALLVDGQLIKQWVDTEEFAGQGGGLRFVHQGQGKVKLSNLRVTEWDGQFEEKPSMTVGSKQDLVKLRNGDKLSGHVEGVRDGKMIVTTEATRLEIPMARVKQAELAGAKTEQAAANANLTRASFERGGALTFQLEKWEDGKALVRSPNFGELTFDGTVFSRLEFHVKPVTP